MGAPSLLSMDTFKKRLKEGKKMSKIKRKVNQKVGGGGQNRNKRGQRRL